MGTHERGAGEQLELARRRKKFVVIGGLIAVGFVSGLLVSEYESGSVFDLESRWPPAMALGIAAAYLAAMIGGHLALNRQMDEVEKGVHYKAAAAAGGAFALVYPTWFALWKGGFLPEPIHWVLFSLFWVILALSSIYYRFR